MKRLRFRCLALAGGLVAFSPVVRAQQDHTNLDEAKVGAYTLPPLLVSADGKPVRTARQWTSRRRPEILKLFQDHMHGRTPVGAAQGSDLHGRREGRRRRWAAPPTASRSRSASRRSRTRP